MLTDFLSSHGFGLFEFSWIQFGLGFVLAFAIMIIFGRMFINAMHHWQKKGQPISENVPESHRVKAGTPTMGGVLIVLAILISSIVFMPKDSITGWISLLGLSLFALIGFLDDFKKVTSQSKKASNGLSRSTRLIAEAVFVIILAYLINKSMPQGMPPYSIFLPFSLIPLSLGCIVYYIFAYFVITGSANATNISDGLDGMLSKLYIPVLLVLVVALSTRIGSTDTVLRLPAASGLYPVLGAALGAVLGFLWFNAKPASIFMGDTGSLALGGFMGTVAMLLKSEVIMGIAAGMMVLILLSSFVQTMFFKITRITTGTGKRIFLRAPLHHHFEEKGWAETKIVDRFFIMSILFSALALILLKFA
ncbi:MAG: phospho-N-acetylmuramoyl-pentapeptide-transferase [Alphaproteobacteria bacterium]|nr:phospho-N-acetylmuramoyl-pentapeptide-transferase [Alphaproteobacteria bacterium]